MNQGRIGALQGRITELEGENERLRKENEELKRGTADKPAPEKSGRRFRADNAPGYEEH